MVRRVGWTMWCSSYWFLHILHRIRVFGSGKKFCLPEILFTAAIIILSANNVELGDRRGTWNSGTEKVLKEQTGTAKTMWFLVLNVSKKIQIHAQAKRNTSCVGHCTFFCPSTKLNSLFSLFSKFGLHGSWTKTFNGLFMHYALW